MLKEGGNLVSGSEPILAGRAREIANTVVSDLEKEFGAIVKIKGSLNVKQPNEYCNDIDIVMQYDWNQENIDHLKNFLMQKYSCEEPSINNGLRVISFGYKYNSEDGHYRIIQIDVCQTNNIDFHMKYHSPSIGSQFKNFIKDTLLRIIVKVTPIEGKEDEYFGDEFGDEWKGKLKSKWSYSITNDDDVVMDWSSRMGKKGKPVSKLQIDQSLRQPYTKDFDIAMKQCLGPQVTESDLSSTESLIAYLFSGKYPYASKERLDIIRDKMVDHLSDRGTEEEKIKLPQMFLSVWNKYAGENNLNEARYSNFSLKMQNIMKRMEIL